MERVISRAIRRNLVLAAGMAAIVLIVWFAWKVLLDIFLGILVGIALKAIVVWVQRKAGLSSRLSYILVLLSAVCIIGVIAWLLAPRVASQASEIISQLPRALERLEHNMETRGWGHILDPVLLSGFTASSASKIGNGLLVIGGAVIVAIVVGLYSAADSAFYVRNALRVVPQRHRERVAGLLEEIQDTLERWILGQLVPMTVLGVATMIGLWLMHVPLAFTLGLFTGLMIFIPYIGAIVAGIPPALIALLQSPMKMVLVLAFYIGVHCAEGYVLTPLVQRRAVRLPPVLTIVAQLFMWEIAGILGVVTATPLAAAALVMVKHLLLQEQPDQADRIAPRGAGRNEST